MFSDSTVTLVKGFWRGHSFIENKEDYFFPENDNLEHVIRDFCNIKNRKSYHYKEQDIMIAHILDLFNTI